MGHSLGSENRKQCNYAKQKGKAITKSAINASPVMINASSITLQIVIAS
jgi:hypothetical protein